MASRNPGGRASSADAPYGFPAVGLGVLLEFEVAHMHLMVVVVAEVDAVHGVGRPAS